MVEADTRSAIKAFVTNHGGKCVVLHGSSLSEGGQPDIDGVIPVKYRGHTFQIPFKVELKVPGREPKLRQKLRLKEWEKYPIYCVGWVNSLEGFKRLIRDYTLSLVSSDIDLNRKYEKEWEINYGLDDEITPNQ